MNRLTAVLLSIAVVITTPGSAFANGLDNLVKIDSGVLAGSGTAVRVYKGIPFAAPPVGALRWGAPEVPKPWQGIRVAKSFAAPCAQALLIAQTQSSNEQKSSEDCLALNVWTPAKNPNEKLPVLVWIHGGGFFAGTSSSTVYDGESFAKQGIVYVSINYRLGLFGFLAHPELSKESPQGTSGNYALQDMIAALQWIKRNIAAFGGDPTNVTIWGESAGGTATALLMVAPDAKDLFHKAIVSSAWNVYQPISHRTQSRYGRMPAEQAGEKLGALAALRALSTDEVIKLRAGIEFNADGEHSGEIHYHIVDGVTVPDDPALLFEAGKFHAVPLLAGTVANEGTLFARNMRKSDQVKSWIARAIDDKAIATLQTQYEMTGDAQASAAFANLFGDAAFNMGTRAILRATAKTQPRVFQYQFSRVAGFGKRTRLGAFHASELGYSFATLPDSPYGTTGVFVSILSFFIGGVLALQAGYSMESFGAKEFIGSLVGLSMARELGPLMVAILLAGRVGSAIAAELASMKVYQEVDALVTMNIPPERILVLPRLAAVIVMMPVLTIIANLVGWFGGAIVAHSVDFIALEPEKYFETLRRFTKFEDVANGLIKAEVFGFVVVLICCSIGLNTRGGPREIGAAVTKAVVVSLILILVLDYFLTQSLL